MEESTKDEIERIHKELEKPETGINPSCPLCKHYACDKLTEVYFENEKDVAKASEWFEETFKKTIVPTTFDRHFREHINPFVTKTSFLRKKKIEDLKQIAINAPAENTNRFNLIKQIAWEFMQDIYINRKDELKTKEDKAEFQRMVKTFTELSKMYKEYYQMELEIIGMGKTEEEQKRDMENFVAGLLKQAMGSLKDHPDAQRTLSNWVNLNMEGLDEKEFVVEDDDGI